MGSCDWNDGMDKVGNQGTGESVWLGFFLYQVLRRFADLADTRDDGAFAANCREQAERLRVNIDKHGRSEEQQSDLQSLMRIPYAVSCSIKKKKQQQATILKVLPTTCKST